MIDTIAELKDFICWCRKEGIKEVSIPGCVSFSVSDAAIINNLVNIENPLHQDESTYDEEDDLNYNPLQDDENIKFWSAQ